ncbi:MAG: hypothetical protein IMY72_11660 [Bacteroidetes bacterium]|nr:hypothetical protein [Bacteroidota bacterium]
MVAKMADTRFFLFRTKILPPNSPTLFGVKMETVTPDKTAFSDFENVIFSKFFTNNFHFADSILQFANISNKTIIKINKLK